MYNFLKQQCRMPSKGLPKVRGRKQTKTLQESKYENKRLRIEVELLQDFLQFAERM